MDKREFDGLLRAKTPIQSAFFFGGCDYLADKYTAMLLATLPQGNDISKMYFDEYMFDEAKTILSQNSLFGDIPVLLLKHEKKIPKKELQELISIADKNKGLFIYRYFGDLTKKDEEYVKSFVSTSHAYAVRFFQPNNFDEALSYILDEAKERHITLQPSVARELLELKNNDLTATTQEIERLSIMGGDITSSILKETVEESLDSRIERIFDAIVAKQEFAPLVIDLLEKAEFDEIRIILFLQNLAYELFLFLLCIKAYGSADSIKVTGRRLPDSIVRQKATKAIKMSFGTYQMILTQLTQADLLLKTAKNQDKSSLLIASLMKLQNAL